MELSKFRISSIEELDEVARVFLLRYPKPGIFLLNAEMGAGKTTFVKAICKALHLNDVSSPTFSLVNHYKNENASVYHFDLYRLKTIEEALDFGFEEYLEKDAYVFIEWPELIRPLLPTQSTEVVIQQEDGFREISF